MKRLRKYTHRIGAGDNGPEELHEKGRDLLWVRTFYLSLNIYIATSAVTFVITMAQSENWGHFLSSFFFACMFLLLIALDRYVFLPKMVSRFKTCAKNENSTIDGRSLKKVKQYMHWQMRSRPLFFLPLLGIDIFVNSLGLKRDDYLIYPKFSFIPLLLVRQLVAYIKFRVCGILISSLWGDSGGGPGGSSHEIYSTTSVLNPMHPQSSSNR